MDKSRIEAVIRQTTLERNALEKSLDVMEKENAALSRQLQIQVLFIICVENIIKDSYI
jgi:hypothetical protein